MTVLEIIILNISEGKENLSQNNKKVLDSFIGLAKTMLPLEKKHLQEQFDKGYQIGYHDAQNVY